MEDRFAKITISFDNGRTFVLNALSEDVEEFKVQKRTPKKGSMFGNRRNF